MRGNSLIGLSNSLTMKFPTYIQQLNHSHLPTLARVTLTTKPHLQPTRHLLTVDNVTILFMDTRGLTMHRSNVISVKMVPAQLVMTSVAQIALVHGTQQTSMRVIRVLATTSQLITNTRFSNHSLQKCHNCTTS